MTTNNLTAPNAHPMRDYVAGAPGALAPEAARRLIDHAAECDECAELLTAHPAHAIRLLEERHLLEEPSPSDVVEVAADQQGILVFADAALERLSPPIRSFYKTAFSDDELLRERRKDLSYLGHLSIERLRAALSIAEVVLSVRSQLTSVRSGPASGVLSKDGLLLDQGRSVSASYFARRIADYADTSSEAAAAFWNAAVETAISGHDLPGVYISDVTAETTRVAIVQPIESVDIMELVRQIMGPIVVPRTPARRVYAAVDRDRFAALLMEVNRCVLRTFHPSVRVEVDEDAVAQKVYLQIADTGGRPLCDVGVATRYKAELARCSTHVQDVLTDFGGEQIFNQSRWRIQLPSAGRIVFEK